MSFRTLCGTCGLLASFALAGAINACDAGGADNTGNPNTTNTDPNEPGTATLAISFLPMGPTDTRCGNAAGVHVQINDGAGDIQSCDAKWAPAEQGGQPVGDCLFVVHPGSWGVDNISIVDANNEALGCCSGTYPENVSVAESSTTEFGASFTCDTVSNGALDIFATVNRPPTIENITISPSKFGNTCSLITLGAQGSDPDGDGVSFTWGVADGPKGSQWAVTGRGATGYFVGNGLGTYTMRLAATDDFGASHHLDFPIHLTGGGTCDVDARMAELLP